MLIKLVSSGGLEAALPAPPHHQETTTRGHSLTGSKAFHVDDDDDNLRAFASWRANQYLHAAKPQYTAKPAPPTASSRHSTHRSLLACGRGPCTALSAAAGRACVISGSACGCACPTVGQAVVSASLRPLVFPRAATAFSARIGVGLGPPGPELSRTVGGVGATASAFAAASS